MSDLFMDMHHRRLNRVASLNSKAASFGSTNGSISGSGSNTNGDCSTVSSFYLNGANSFAENGPSCDEEAEEENDDEFSNFLSLKLKKPKHWKWELSTSRSCSNIALPRIMLYDHKGHLLVDANSQEEQVYKEDELKRQRREARKRSNKAATTNMEQSIRKALDNEFNGLKIQEATPSLSPESIGRFTLSRSVTSNSAIDFNTNELSDYKSDRRSSSSKGVRFNVDDSYKESNSSFHIVDLPTPPSTTTGTSSSSGPKQKRRYRRSRSSGRSPGRSSESILERFSCVRGRFSSPEFAEEHQVFRPPRYFLRTSKAGTLVVQEDSFSRCRRRRKMKNSSSENILNDSGSKSQSINSLKMNHPTYLKAVVGREMQAGSLQNVTELKERKKRLHPVRRYRSDGNMLLQKQLSTSDDENEEERRKRRGKDYTSFRKQSKRNIITMNADNGVDSPTAR